MRSRFSSLFIAAAATLTVALSSPYAHAVGDDEASPKYKGIAGGIGLGAESVMLVEAALGVKPFWPYLVGGVLGGAAGGVAGHFIEDGADDARVPMFMLAGALVLSVPTWVAVKSALSYKPPANYVEDKGPSDEPVAEPPQPSTTPAAPAPATPATGGSSLRAPKHTPRTARVARLSLYGSEPRALIPPSLVGLDRGLLSLGVPVVELHNVYSKRELLQTGLKQETEVRIPVFNFSF
jgi:hypothetical protein